MNPSSWQPRTDSAWAARRKHLFDRRRGRHCCASAALWARSATSHTVMLSEVHLCAVRSCAILLDAGAGASREIVMLQKAPRRFNGACCLAALVLLCLPCQLHCQVAPASAGSSLNADSAASIESEGIEATLNSLTSYGSNQVAHLLHADQFFRRGQQCDSPQRLSHSARPEYVIS